MPLPFTLSPKPRAGQGPYGLVPGEQGLPDPYADLAARYPGLDASNAKISQNVMSELQGELPPDVISAIQDDAARFGLTSGMPGSDLARRRGARNLGLTSLGLTQRGLQDYLGATQGIKSTQTVSPELQANIAAGNALYNAAPDPAAAAAEMERKYRAGLAIPGGGGGGSINPGMPNLSLPPLVGGGGVAPYSGGTRGTGGINPSGNLAIGAPAPYGNQSGVNPWTGMPTAQDNGEWDFGLNWGDVGPDQSGGVGGGFGADYGGQFGNTFGGGDTSWDFGLDWGDVGADNPLNSIFGFDPNDPFGLGEYGGDPYSEFDWEGG